MTKVLMGMLLKRHVYLKMYVRGNEICDEEKEEKREDANMS